MTSIGKLACMLSSMAWHSLAAKKWGVSGESWRVLVV